MKKNPSSSKAVAALIDEAIALAGTQEKLGQKIGVSQNAIYHARKNGRTSASLAVGIDRATSGQVSKSKLRPDLWPPSQRQSVST